MAKIILLDEEKIEGTIGAVVDDSFTVLDLTDIFKEKYPIDWKNLVEIRPIWEQEKIHCHDLFFEQT